MNLEDERLLVAKEAARLLYYRLATEYKFAKLRAARELGVNVLPSNREVAEQLDLLADLLEGESRVKRLVEMRRAALRIMRVLSDFSPRLIGSVWRGTVRVGSDIDIIVYADSPSIIVEKLKSNGFSISFVERKVKVYSDTGVKKIYTHIHISLPQGFKAEIVVREPEDIHIEETCDIYGDVIKGLTISELEEILVRDPARKFVP
ncbi:MAG: nucleotidyltransferase domain-containing protein [archaeon GB-1867-035]|nr:nucleotidyltransferase domain-containing protein [Candidatus Culexmicrobium profundum]